MKTKEMILIENSEGVLVLITEKQFAKLIMKDEKYKLIGAIRPKYSKRYLTTEQKEKILDSIRANPKKFHHVSTNEVIANMKEIVFKDLNGD